jgi:Tat protein translocase TatB subunit
MFGIGITEIIVILVVALLVVGPKKLPDLAKTLGRAMAEFRRTADDFKESIYKDDDSSVDADRERVEKQQQTSKIIYPLDPPSDPVDGNPVNKRESQDVTDDEVRQEESPS